MKKVLPLIFLLSPVLLLAQGFQVNLQGQRQQAMAGASVSNGQDPASLFFNPGSSSFVRENGVSIAVSPVISQGTFTDNGAYSTSKTTSPVSFPFAGYFLFGKKESNLKYGLAVYNPFGSTIRWEDAWTGRFAITTLQLQTTFFQPAVSYKLSEKVGLGAGFVLGTAKMNLQSDLPIPDGNGNYTSSLELKGNGNGFGFNAGVYYKPIDKLSFGISYRSGIKMKVSNGNATFNVPSSMTANFPSGGFSTCLPLPKVISVGGSYAASKKLTVAAEITMVGWKTYDTLNYDFEKNTNEVTDRKMARDYKNTFSYRLGGEYGLSEKLQIRAGVKYLSTPVPNGKVTPEVPDASHLSYSAGVGFKINSRLSADASFTYEDIRRTDNNTDIQLSGSYHTRLYIPGISISYRFK